MPVTEEAKKQNRYQDQCLPEHFDRSNAGENEKFWSEAVSMKQSKRQTTNNIEEKTVRAKTLCSQGQFCRAAKVLVSQGVALKLYSKYWKTYT